MCQLERGEVGALEAIDALLSEEHATRETRRIGVALKTPGSCPQRMLESFDFTFQPSLDREPDQAMALARLDFVARAEVLHFSGHREPKIHVRHRAWRRRGEGRHERLPQHFGPS